VASADRSFTSLNNVVARVWDHSQDAHSGMLRGGDIIMRILLSLVALFGLLAIADIGLSPSANATTLTSGVQALKAEKTSVAEKAYYRRGYYRGGYYRRGYYRRGYGYGYGRRCWWRYGRRICRW
jgi:hypothetical protein